MSANITDILADTERAIADLKTDARYAAVQPQITLLLAIFAAFRKQPGVKGVHLSGCEGEVFEGARCTCGLHERLAIALKEAAAPHFKEMREAVEWQVRDGIDRGAIVIKAETPK